MIVAHGALQAFLAVVCGAFGAHGLHFDEYSSKIWQTAVFYHLTHALGIVLLGQMRDHQVTHWCFGIGILLFSGSLYALALSGVKALGMITPLGGTAFLIGWAALAWRSYRYR